MTVLIAYATVNGSTGEIAEWIGEELRVVGLAADVRPVAEVTGVDEYEAVVVGSAMYMAGWHAEARKFVHWFAGALARRPVWLFSSGPLDTSAEEAELPPGPQAAAILRKVNARGHITFGGKVSKDAHGWLGLVARRIETEGRGGDFRNPERVRVWAREIATKLTTAA
jgi:menaquinone-dependent protoporphyrinogen oxidase